ncbi:LuxR C-terminal-related transcriptional regulator [Microbacterium sp.]|uniref:LuxR C-terminal-related transcriptional regulator n=1 Tax=Microbacterium sp. TaxID=51671 RepID=UPI0039E4C47F
MARMMPSSETDWVARFDALSARAGDPRADELTTAEWEELGQAAWFVGREADGERAWDRARARHLREGDVDGAIRCVFWAGYSLAETAPTKAAAWMARLFELCEQNEVGARSTAARALCLAVSSYMEGRVADSVALFETALDAARAAGDEDAGALARMGLARSMLAIGRVVEAFACMDQVMLAIEGGAVSDLAAGPVYCAVIASCLARRDLDRARLWTRELNAWCDAQHGLEPFRGECTVHRAEVLAIVGEWAEARSLLHELCASERSPSVLERALYALGELERLTGRRARANAAFLKAAQLGGLVQPGLALLRREEGDLTAARSGVRRALAGEPEPGARTDLLAARVELSLDAGDLADAEDAATQLRALAEVVATDYVRATAADAAGAVETARGDPTAAIASLRRAWATWRRLDAPYRAARTRVQLAVAAQALGDDEGAQLEFDAARSVFTELTAIADLARLERLASAREPGPADALTPREREVLGCIAQGLTNRGIAQQLFLSEPTVATHVAHILAKLGLPNRSAATAFAFENRLVPAP